MSRKYKFDDRIPTIVLAKRCKELSDVVTKGKAAIDREFTMRVPAELDRDPDLVLAETANRLLELQTIINGAVANGVYVDDSHWWKELSRVAEPPAVSPTSKGGDKPLGETQ